MFYDLSEYSAKAAAEIALLAATADEELPLLDREIVEDEQVPSPEAALMAKEAIELLAIPADVVRYRQMMARALHTTGNVTAAAAAFGVTVRFFEKKLSEPMDKNKRCEYVTGMMKLGYSTQEIAKSVDLSQAVVRQIIKRMRKTAHLL